MKKYEMIENDFINLTRTKLNRLKFISDRLDNKIVAATWDVLDNEDGRGIGEAYSDTYNLEYCIRYPINKKKYV